MQTGLSFITYSGVHRKHIVVYFVNLKEKWLKNEKKNLFKILFRFQETTLDISGKRQSSLRSTGYNGIDSGIEECHSNTSHEVESSRTQNQRSTPF